MRDEKLSVFPEDVEERLGKGERRQRRDVGGIEKRRPEQAFSRRGGWILSRRRPRRLNSGLVKPAAFAALLLAGVLAVGCGGESGPAGELDDTLGYFPEDAGVVVVVNTDLGGNQLDRFDRKIVRPESGGESMEDLLREVAEDIQLSWDQDVKPLLGNPLVVGTQSTVELTGISAAIQVRDEGKLHDLAEKIPGATPEGEAHGAELYEAEAGIAFAIEGDFLIIAQDQDTLLRALEQRDSDDGLSEAELEESLPGAPEDPLVRARATVTSLEDFFGLSEDVPEAERLFTLPWFAALRTVGVTASFADDEHLVVDASLNTDAGELNEDDLPLATGEESPEVVSREGEIVSANRDQSRTTVFLLRAAQAAFPNSRFVQAVEELEQDLGVDFEDEILRQFDGPSASALTFDGQSFAARSEVRDPDRLREQLRVLAPRLPELVQGLEGLRSQGLALLLLLAPDAIASTQPLDDVQVELPQGPDDLYHVSGLTGDGPSNVYFGLVGDVFVIASDEGRARAIADAPTEGLEDAHGAAVARLDLREGARELLERFGLGLGAEVEIGEVVGSLEASTERLHATLRVELP